MPLYLPLLTTTIQDELKKIGSPPATFETDEDRRAVTVTIPIQPEYYRYIMKKKSKRNNETTRTTQSTTQTTQSVLSETEEKILMSIRENGRISQAKIADVTGLDVNTVKYYIRSLTQKGVLGREGNNRSGIWVILTDD